MRSGRAVSAAHAAVTRASAIEDGKKQHYAAMTKMAAAAAKKETISLTFFKKLEGVYSVLTLF